MNLKSFWRTVKEYIFNQREPTPGIVAMVADLVAENDRLKAELSKAQAERNVYKINLDHQREVVKSMGRLALKYKEEEAAHLDTKYKEALAVVVEEINTRLEDEKRDQKDG